MNDWVQDSLNFASVMDMYRVSKPSIPPSDVVDFRMDLIREEVGETLDGMLEDDVVKVADGIADSIVVLLGTAIAYGIDMRPVWDEVHKANMAKVGGPKRADGKQLKPEGWQSPNIQAILDKQKILGAFVKDTPWEVIKEGQSDYIGKVGGE